MPSPSPPSLPPELRGTVAGDVVTIGCIKATVIGTGPASEQQPRAAAHWTQNIGGGERGRRGFSSAMNKTETAYARHLEDLKDRGEIVDWRWNPATLRLSDTPQEGGGKGKRYTADFAVIYADRVEMHDTKGGYTTAEAWTTLRFAAEVYWWLTFAKVTKRKKADGGGWLVERV